MLPLIGLLAALGAPPASVVVGYDVSDAPVAFAAAEIRAALGATAVSEIPVSDALRSKEGRCFILVHGQAPTGLKVQAPRRTGPQTYAIRRLPGRDAWMVIGGDAAGAMCGGLELAERLRTGVAISETDAAPHIAQRGIKFNIPLDVRTPSYSDNSDSAQNNIPEMWSFDLWRELLDNMARHRYNVLSLWNLHPFPSIVKVPEYPDVALNDVRRTRLKLDDTFSHTGNDMVRPAMLADTEVVKSMSIDEKIRFWRDVMQHARDRGIDVYWFTWNIFTWGAEGKYGITPQQTNTTTVDYFRRSVRETVLTYPLLAGIGITAGEQMENRKDEWSKEKWLWKAYGEGIRDALRLQPERKFRLIHRFHQTGFGEILNEWKDYPGPFDLSFKYAIAHMYASTKPPFIESALPHLSPKLRTWLTVRNDDIYSFRWGDPEFAREFIRNIPGPDKVAGFYMGPDGYVWGREFLSTETPREPVISKQWYSFLLWGRMSYDPELPESRLHAVLASRFREAPAPRLAAAWAQASRVMPEITRFSWGDIDLRWFPEASISHRRHRGYYTVRHFIEGNTMPGSGNIDVLTWRERVLSKTAPGGKTPLEVAASLESYATTALSEVATLRKEIANPGKELRLTLGDIEAMALLGRYYAAKIRGAAELALFDRTGDPKQKEAAVARLNEAAGFWRSYAEVYSRQYKPQLLNRVGYTDIPGLLEKVKSDVEIARNWESGTIKDDSGRFRGADRPFQP